MLKIKEKGHFFAHFPLNFFCYFWNRPKRGGMGVRNPSKHLGIWEGVVGPPPLPPTEKPKGFPSISAGVGPPGGTKALGHLKAFPKKFLALCTEIDTQASGPKPRGSPHTTHPPTSAPPQVFRVEKKPEWVPLSRGHALGPFPDCAPDRALAPDPDPDPDLGPYHGRGPGLHLGRDPGCDPHRGPECGGHPCPSRRACGPVGARDVPPITLTNPALW